MTKSIKTGIAIIAFAWSFSLVNAQEFLQNKTGQPFTFKEMQRQFDAWSKKTDLKNNHYWKYYKRWESDMQMHTDVTGEPADPAIFVHEAVKYAQEKSQSKSASFSSFSWIPLGPNSLPANQTGYMENGIGRINCIAFHPTNPSIYFVGVAQGGLWKTTNNGVSWTPLTDNLPITRISDICIDPNNPSIMYISVCDFEYINISLRIDGRKRNTHYGLGVYKTIDGGVTWQPTGLSFLMTNGDASLIRKILVNQTNSNQLVACGVRGMYTSANGGTTWTRTLDSLFWDLAQDPVLPNTLYAATGWLNGTNRGSAGIYKSTNFGASWTLLNTGIPPTGTVQRVKLAIAPSDNNYIYAMTVNLQSGMYGIYKSINAGVNWQLIIPSLNVLEANMGNGTGGQGNYDLGFAVKMTDRNTVYVGGINLYASNDGAATFNPVSHWTLNYGPTIHGDIHFIANQPGTGNVFVCSDGGAYRTTNIISQTWSSAISGVQWPTQWTKLNSGMAVSSFYRISSSRNSAGRLIAGAQDNGSMYYNGTSWSTIFGGDGMDNYLDPVDNNVIVGSSQYGNFSKSINGGVTNFGINPNVNSEAGEWTTPLTPDYTIYGTLYAGFVNVNKSTDGGNFWTALSPLPNTAPNNNELSSIAVAYSNSNVIYATKRIRYEFNSPSSMYVTTNGGTSWTNITAGILDSLYFTSTDVSHVNPNIAYVTLAGFSAGNKIYKTTNGGTSWQNISFNLPNIPVNCVKTIPGNDSVMIATDLGVYILNNTTNTWVSQSTGLPNVITTDIEFNVALNKVYLSTFGRGVWQADLGTLLNVHEKNPAYIAVELFPTVNDGSFTIKLTNEDARDESLSLEIIDVTGRLIYSSTLTGQTNYPQHLNLLPGLYYARINGKKLNGVKTFVVQ